MDTRLHGYDTLFAAFVRAQMFNELIAPVPHMKESDQILYVRPVGVYTDTVNINCPQHTPEVIKPHGSGTAVLVSEFSA
jgi:hypothetical protein